MHAGGDNRSPLAGLSGLKVCPVPVLAKFRPDLCAHTWTPILYVTVDVDFLCFIKIQHGKVFL